MANAGNGAARPVSAANRAKGAIEAEAIEGTAVGRRNRRRNPPLPIRPRPRRQIQIGTAAKAPVTRIAASMEFAAIMAIAALR